MFNFKLSGITAGAALIFSLVIGLLSGVRIPIVFLRAFIFAVIFFGLTCLVYWLISQFVPELLSEPDDILDIPAPGSRVDITVEDSQIVGAFPANNSESVDDIGGRPSTPDASRPPAKPDRSGLEERAPTSPLDQKEKELYNDDGAEGDFDFEGGSFKDLTGDTSEDPEEYPENQQNPENLETLENDDSETVLNIDGVSGTDAAPAIGDDAADFDESEPRRPSSSRGNPELAGDFNPKELAMGIRTVLKRDERG